ncbi:hypothetical protein OSTOST_14886 [Ostertagia ostertagi]
MTMKTRERRATFGREPARSASVPPRKRWFRRVRYFRPVRSRFITFTLFLLGLDEIPVYELLYFPTISVDDDDVLASFGRVQSHEAVCDDVTRKLVGAITTWHDIHSNLLRLSIGKRPR